MKNLRNQFNWIALFSVFVIFAAACGSERTAEKDPVISEQTKEGDENKTIALIELEGMSCEIGCARFIKGKLAKLDGVIESEVLFEEKTATVSYDPLKISGNDLVGHIQGLNEGQYKVTKVNIEKTVKRTVSIQESAPGKKGTNEKVDVNYEPPFKSIVFPNIFNLFKLKLV